MELITYDLPWKPITIAPLGDIQWAGRKSEIAWDHLERHVDEAMRREAWFVGMGDYIDFMSPSNRKRLQGAALYDTATAVVDDKALELTMELYDKLLKPTVGRWLGLLEGHHYTQLQSGMTTDQKLAELLGARFLGTSAYIRLFFTAGQKHKDGTGAHTEQFLIWVHHGAGGGMKAHAPILKLENLATYWKADLFLIGHHTKIAAVPINRVYPVFPRPGKAKHPVPAKLRHRRIHLVGTGGWLKGYEDFSRQGQIPRGNYVEQKMLNPVALGAPFVRITPKSQPAETAHEARERGITYRAYEKHLDCTIEV